MKKHSVLPTSGTGDHSCDEGCREKARFMVSHGDFTTFLCPNCLLRYQKLITDTFAKWFKDSH